MFEKVISCNVMLFMKNVNKFTGIMKIIVKSIDKIMKKFYPYRHQHVKGSGADASDL